MGYLGQGFPFPWRGPLMGSPAQWVGAEEKVRQSIYMILSTAPGERVMRPEFGCGIHDLVFEANNLAFQGVVALKVREALVRWEPRIDVLAVNVGVPAERGNHLEIALQYRIRGNNAIYNQVYPFFQTEGASQS